MPTLHVFKAAKVLVLVVSVAIERDNTQVPAHGHHQQQEVRVHRPARGQHDGRPQLGHAGVRQLEVPPQGKRRRAVLQQRRNPDHPVCRRRVGRPTPALISGSRC